MLTDQPITTAKDDLLGRAPFAQQVASAMLASPSDQSGSFSIGLFGGWGSGKTSVLNMVAEALVEKAARKRQPAPIVVQFNPWQYPAAELLAGQLMQAVALELRKPERSERLQKAGKAMVKYAAAMAACGPETRVETVAELRGEAGAPAAGNVPQNVQERKQKVAKHLKKQDEKIYVIMDDIDRLSSRRIRHALQLVNAVAGFPRMVYLLSFDQEVVTAALTKELAASGWEYLKKFIQVQFTMPSPDPARIRAILTEYVTAFLETEHDVNFDPQYYAEVSPYIFRCIETIRDVYRFINTFRNQIQMLGNEVNFTDLLAVTALQLHIPQALPWLQDHRDDLLRGGGLAYHGADAEQRKALAAEHRRMIAQLSEPDAKTLIPLIGHLFPRYGRNVLDVKGEESDQRYVRMRRICCEEFFDLYFAQSTKKLAITQEEILKSVHEMGEEELRQYLDGLQSEERRNAYLSHLPHYLADIPKDHLAMFFFETLRLSRLPEGKTPKDKPFQRTFFHECCFVALRILAGMERGEQAQCLKEAAAKADKDTLPILVTLFQRMLQRNPDAEGVEINEELVKGFLRQLLNKIHGIALDGGWIDSHKPLPVMEYWKQADSVSFHVYFQKIMKDDRNAAKLVSCLTQRFNQGMNMEYQYGDMNGRHAFSDEFPAAAAKAAVFRLKGSEAFRALPEDVRMDCVAFSLMDESLGRVTHEDVLKAYPEWMSAVKSSGEEDDD